MIYVIYDLLGAGVVIFTGLGFYHYIGRNNVQNITVDAGITTNAAKAGTTTNAAKAADGKDIGSDIKFFFKNSFHIIGKYFLISKKKIFKTVFRKNRSSRKGIPHRIRE